MSIGAHGAQEVQAMGVAATRVSTTVSFRWSVRIVEEQQRLRAGKRDAHRPAIHGPSLYRPIEPYPSMTLEALARGGVVCVAVIEPLVQICNVLISERRRCRAVGPEADHRAGRGSAAVILDARARASSLAYMRRSPGNGYITQAGQGTSCKPAGSPRRAHHRS
jgi:hypothetical protein